MQHSVVSQKQGRTISVHTFIDDTIIHEPAVSWKYPITVFYGMLQCHRVCKESERRIHLSEKLHSLESLVERMGAQHGYHHITPTGIP